MFIIPVEKKGKYSDSPSLRFLCFDPTTRMAYLSDKGSKVRQWKHRLKVYAIMPKCMQGNEPIPYRLWNFEAKELLTFTVSGVTYHRLDSSNAADRAELQRLPQLLNVSYQDSAPSIRTYTDGAEMQNPTEQPVCLTDDASFFSKDRQDWLLRCPYCNAVQDMILLMRDTLIADGLRYPLYGGLLTGADPRNGLRLASFPLYLLRDFRQLATAIVYSAVHGKMVGCDPHGNIGVCMRHAYLCITDQDVLFVAENGCVARSVPLTHLQKVEYNTPVAASHPSSPHSPLQPTSSHTGHAGRAAIPYVAFLSTGGSADVLFSPCSAFPAESEDCSASMAAAMPRLDVGKAMAEVVHILKRLLHTNAGPKTHPGEDFDADVELENSADSLDLDNAASLATPSRAAPADPASLPDTFGIVALPASQTLHDFVEGFQAAHGRSFKWQPLPGVPPIHPTVQSAASVGFALGKRPPPRQPITHREEFLPYYYGSAAAAKAHEELVAAIRAERRERSSAMNRTSGTDDLYGEDVFAPTVPVRRVSKLLKMFKPDQDIY